MVVVATWPEETGTGERMDMGSLKKPRTTFGRSTESKRWRAFSSWWRWAVVQHPHNEEWNDFLQRQSLEAARSPKESVWTSVHLRPLFRESVHEADYVMTGKQ